MHKTVTQHLIVVIAAFSLSEPPQSTLPHLADLSRSANEECK